LYFDAVFGAIAEAVVLGVTDAFIWPKPTLAIYTPITFRHGAVSKFFAGREEHHLQRQLGGAAV